MKSKAIIKFHLNETSTSMIMFYTIFFAIEAIMIITSISLKSPENLTFNGGEISSWIYIFVIGLMMFKKPMNFFTAHGVSRKTAVKSLFMTAGLFSLGMAVIDVLNFAIIGATGIFKGEFNSLYGTRFGKELSMKYIPEFLTNQFISLLFYVMLAYLIGVVLYRLPMKVKIGLIIGVFAVMFLAPFGLVRLPHGILNIVEKAAKTFYKHVLINPVGNSIFKAGGIVAFGAVSYLTAVRASFSEKT